MGYQVGFGLFDVLFCLLVQMGEYVGHAVDFARFCGKCAWAGKGISGGLQDVQFAAGVDKVFETFAA